MGSSTARRRHTKRRASKPAGTLQRLGKAHIGDTVAFAVNTCHARVCGSFDSKGHTWPTAARFLSVCTISCRLLDDRNKARQVAATEAAEAAAAAAAAAAQSEESVSANTQSTPTKTKEVCSSRRELAIHAHRVAVRPTHGRCSEHKCSLRQGWSWALSMRGRDDGVLLTFELYLSALL